MTGEQAKSIEGQVSVPTVGKKDGMPGPSYFEMDTPQVVFGMPVYNQANENYLEAAVNSIRAQTWTDFHLVIVDDASTDGTWDLVQKIAHQDSRIRAFRNKERLGSIPNFRRCFELSQPSDLFAWASQHDWYEPDWLREMINALQKDPHIGMAYSFVSQHSSSGEKLNLPFCEFETVGLEDHERVLKTIWAHEGAGSMVYGLFHSNILQRCGIYRDLLFPDIQLLTELAFWGAIRQVPRELWHRRVNDNYSLPRQRSSGFACPPWYTRYSVQLVNSGALLWARCLSPYAGSLTSRRLGGRAAWEYFIANPRYQKTLERRRAFWLKRELLYGDFPPPHLGRPETDPNATEKAGLGDDKRDQRDERLFNWILDKLGRKLIIPRPSHVDKLERKLKNERRTREEMKAEIAMLKRKLFQVQSRSLTVAQKKAERKVERTERNRFA